MTKPTRVAAPDAYLPAVDFARLISILMVMGGHYMAAPFFARPFHFPIAALFINGPYGVVCFFVISGFVITRRLLRETPVLKEVSPRAFYVQRAARILPLLFLIVLIGSFFTLIHPLGVPGDWVFRWEGARFNLFFFLAILTFTFNWFQCFFFGNWGTFWQVLWSLAVEEQFYATYPLLIRFLGDRGKLTAVLLGLIALGPVFRLGVLLWARNVPYLGYTATFAALDPLALGALAALYHDAHPRPTPSEQRQLRWLGLLGTSMALLVYFRGDFHNETQRIFSPLLIAVGVALYLAASPHLHFFKSAVGLKIAWLGKYSYGAYLYHFLVMFLLWPRLRADLGSFFLFVASTFLLAGISFEFFEFPVNRWVRRRYGASPSALEPLKSPVPAP